MESYWKINDPVETCPYCGQSDIRYSVSTAAGRGVYYGQCYCNKCKACGPRRRFTVEGPGNLRIAAERNETAKKDAICLWNLRQLRVIDCMKYI